MKRVGGPFGWYFVGDCVGLSQITVTGDDIDQVEESAAIIETLLEKYHDKQD